MESVNPAARCPLCGHRSRKLFTAPCDYRKPSPRRPYDVYWCTACDYGQVWPRPTKEEVSEFYDLADYYTHRANTVGKAGPSGQQGFLDRLRAHLSWRLDDGEDLSPDEAATRPGSKALSMLEIGCGNGTNMDLFRARGFSVVGVEPDPAARETAQNSDLLVYAGTAEELPPVVLEKKYDIVLMSHVLEHCIDIHSAVASARILLEDGGCFIVETPNCESFGFKEQGAAWPWSDIPRHLNFFTLSSLRAIMSAHGFRVVAVKHRGFFRQFSNAWLDTEKEVWLAFRRSGDHQWRTEPNYKLRAWKALISSVFSSSGHKYDSVRVIAQLA